MADNQRVYAVGDVHGRADLLALLLDRVAADRRERPTAATTSLIFLGDLINRGPDSAGVLSAIRTLMREEAVVLIKGNHEETFIDAANGDARAARGLLQMGGGATLKSYGFSAQEAAAGRFADLAHQMQTRIPRDDIALLERGHDMVRMGDYLFVHAGIRPGVPIASQDIADLRWIRHDFLRSKRDHGAMIVHGHSIVERVEQHSNRIAVDTGAYRSGMLSAVVFEGDERWIIEAQGSQGSRRPAIR